MHKTEIGPCNISDHIAEKVLHMAQRFYSDPVNVKKYEAWYFDKYGKLPGKGSPT